jgi:hypothetical protein
MRKFWKIPIDDAIKFAKEEINKEPNNFAAYAILTFAIDKLIKDRTNGEKYIYTEVGKDDKMSPGYTAEQVDAREVPDKYK